MWLDGKSSIGQTWKNIENKWKQPLNHSKQEKAGRLEVQPKFKTKWCCLLIKWFSEHIENCSWNRCSRWIQQQVPWIFASLSIDRQNLRVGSYTLPTLHCSPHSLAASPCMRLFTQSYQLHLKIGISDTEHFGMWTCPFWKNPNSIKGCPKYRSNDVTFNWFKMSLWRSK